MTVGGLLVVGALGFVGALTQGVTGLGYGLVVAPALFAALEPRQALFAGLSSAIVVNVLMLGGRRPVVHARPAALVLAAAFPGLAAGAAVVGLVAKHDLQVAVGVAVLAAVLARLWHPGVLIGSARAVARLGAGAVAGFLTTTVSTNGPPLALWLDAERVEPRVARDTLQVLFGALNLTGICLLLVHERPQGEAIAVAVALVPLLAIGVRAGRRLATRLDETGARRAALAIIAATGLLSVIVGLW